MIDEASIRLLFAEALRARSKAYAPYSGVKVGAAILDRNGRIFSGANVESASFGLSLCAERVAAATAIMAGSQEWVAIAVSSDQKLAVLPCGACLQFLAEFGADDLLVVWLEGPSSIKTARLVELLAKPFRLGQTGMQSDSDNKHT